MNEHEVKEVDGKRMLCTCGLWLEGESTWDALMAGSRHAEARGRMSDCSFQGDLKAHREHHGIGRNETAARATMGGRTLSYIEDGQMKTTNQIVGRIHVAIDSLAREKTPA